MSATKIEREARLRARGVWRSVGTEFWQQREDAGLSQAAVAGAAGIAKSYLSEIEHGTAAPSLEVAERIAVVLGSDLSVRLYPSAGPRIRDRYQARMADALLRLLDPRWIPYLEVGVQRPVRGVIDLVLAGRETDLLIAAEIHSELRRLEQQIRWAGAKADALRATDLAAHVRASVGFPPRVARLLVLRSTRTTRELARALPAVLGAAYPALTRDALAALTGPDEAWPGDSIIWASVDGTTASILEGPPHGVSVGRALPTRASLQLEIQAGRRSP